MCGIVGYTGHVQAAPILLDGLARLEYRGYDSAGLAVRDGKAPAEVVKAFLEAKADVNVKVVDGRTPVDAAKTDEIKELLKAAVKQGL